MRVKPLLLVVTTAAVTALAGCASDEPATVTVNNAGSETLESTSPVDGLDPASPTSPADSLAAPTDALQGTVTVTPTAAPGAAPETMTAKATQRRVVGATRTAVATAVATRVVTPSPVVVTRAAASSTVMRTVTSTRTRVVEVPGDIHQVCINTAGERVNCP